MYLPDCCYSMRFTTLSNYYLIDWWCDVDFRLLACWFDFRFCYNYLAWETGGHELASFILLVLQAKRLTKCASDPHSILLSFKHKKQPFRVFRGKCQVSSFFVEKLCFSVFVLNSIEDKDCRFVSREQFHLMVPVSFPFRIQI